MALSRISRLSNADAIFENRKASRELNRDMHQSGLTSELLGQLDLADQQKSRFSKVRRKSPGSAHLPEISNQSTQAGSTAMQAFLERNGMGHRMTKRFQFEREGHHDHLQKICDQIMEKHDREVSEKVARIIGEKRDQRDSKLQHMKEQTVLDREREQKKKDCLATNKEMRRGKSSALAQYQKEKHLERLAYFPFSHGDVVE